MIIDRILDEDRSVHRKQRHTAKRIFERLRDEHGFDGGLTIVKDYVAAQRRRGPASSQPSVVVAQRRRGPASSWPSVVVAQRRRGQEMFVPLTHAPGHAQADFGEADVVIAGVKQRAHFFVMDLPHSDACFVVAYPAATTEAWLDGHIRAFAFFDGIPLSILYDNDSCLVARILPDGTRHLTQGFSGLQSHYLFKDRYGRPGKGNAELEPWRQWRRESQVKGQSRGSGWLCPAQLHGPDPPV